MSTEERAAMQLALGRIFRLASRPSQPDDVRQYEDARAVVLTVLGGEFDTVRPREPAASVLIRHRSTFGDTP